jgi:hypothetical protein
LLDSILDDPILKGNEKLERFIDGYAELLITNSILPRLILREMTMESDIALWFIDQKLRHAFGKIDKIIHEALEDGTLRKDIDVSVLLPSIIANIIFNIIAVPVITVLFKKKPQDLLKSKERIEEIKNVIYYGIKKK